MGSTESSVSDPLDLDDLAQRLKELQQLLDEQTELYDTVQAKRSDCQQLSARLLEALQKHHEQATIYAIRLNDRGEDLKKKDINLKEREEILIS